MKPIIRLYLFLVIIVGTSGCVLSDSTAIPTQVETSASTPTLISPTSIPAFTPTATVTPTLSTTLEPEQAKEIINTLLQEPVDCLAPCFWGIAPGQTTLDEAENIFTRLGLPINSATLDNKEFYGIAYDFNDGLSIRVILTVQDEVVKNLRVGINNTFQAESPRRWSAYSPETLISRYGSPSRVEFFLGRVAPTPTHSMEMYFEQVKLIVQYIGINMLNVNLPKVEICPLTNQVDYIEIWMGDDPQYPPSPSVPLEEAALLTLEEFSELMMGNPDTACFNLREEAFP